MTSICGFLRKDGSPYSMYYALLHDHRGDDFVRLSLSVGQGWARKDFNDRIAVCIDITPQGNEYALSVQDASASPQQDFPAFGQWLNREDAAAHPALKEVLEIAVFILEHDPALKSYLAGEKANLTGRSTGNGAHRQA